MAAQSEQHQYEVAGKVLQCPVCDHDRFWSRRTLLNPVGMSLLGGGSANKEATNLVCGGCSYMFWFHTLPSQVEHGVRHRVDQLV